MAGTILKLRNSLLFFFLSLLIRERERNENVYMWSSSQSLFVRRRQEKRRVNTLLHIYTESEKNENKSAIHVQNAVNERIWNVNFHNNWHGCFLSNRPFLHVIQHHRAYIY